MLRLSLAPGEYFTISGDIVIQLSDISGGRACLRVQADRSVPILRGKVLERQGIPRPACLNAPERKRARRRRDPIYLWSGDRERAVRSMEATLDQMEREGQGEAAGLLRAQLSRLLPTVWEEEVSSAVQAALQHSEAAEA